MDMGSLRPPNRSWGTLETETLLLHRQCGKSPRSPPRTAIFQYRMLQPYINALNDYLTTDNANVFMCHLDTDTNTGIQIESESNANTRVIVSVTPSI